MTTDDLVMPAAVRQELDHLLATIKRAMTSDEAERAGLRAEGFVLGVERLKALQLVSIEALYLLVEQAVELRSGDLIAQK
jgi:tRNA splicing endonuclease